MNDENAIISALNLIVQRYGREIFKEPQRVNALLHDLAPGESNKKERRRIKTAFESGAVTVLMNGSDESEADLYLKEAVSRLINYSDMEERIANEVMLMLASVLSVPVSEKNGTTEPVKKKNPKKTQQAQKEENSKNPSSSGELESKASEEKLTNESDNPFKDTSKKRKVIIGAGAAFLVILLIYAFVYCSSSFTWGVWQWIIGIGGGLVLSALSAAVAFFIEEIVYNEKYQTFTFIIPAVFIANIVLRIVFGVDYEIIARCLSAYIAVGAGISTWLAYDDLENKYMPSNIIVGIISAITVFWWPGAIPWDVWQWFIGIGGGLLVTAAAVFLAWLIEIIGPETYQSLTVMLLIATIANGILLFTQEYNYIYIALCFMVIFSIGAIILAFMAFTDIEGGYGWLNIILALLNTAVFLILVIGSYEVLINMMTSIKDFFASKFQ